MGFIEEYKRLDNLCKQLLNSDTGVSTYISKMEQHRLNVSASGTRNLDYDKLKRYRYIRNRIVHDNDSSESNLCSKGDVRWIKDFYGRILKHTDPLSTFYKLSRSASEKKLRPQNSGRNSEKNVRIYLALASVLIFLLVCVAAYLINAFSAI